MNRQVLSGHGLGLDGGEPGRPDPADFERAALRVLICRLSPYEDVLPSISHRMLLQAALQVPGVYADLAFFPRASDARRMIEDGIPLWLATGCKRPPRDFDIVAISISVQQEAFNLPAALKDSDLALSYRERRTAPDHPWVLLGGHAAGAVPFIHGDAGREDGSGGLVDAVCFGDGITWLQSFLRRWMAARENGLSRESFLRQFAAETTGAYVPSFYRHEIHDGCTTGIVLAEPSAPLPVRYRTDQMDIWLENYSGAYIPFSNEELEETLPLSVGCVYRCRFCQTGWMRGALSASATESLTRAALRLKAAMANSDLNLLASDACSVPALASSVEALLGLFRHVSIKSLALSSLARREENRWLVRKLEKHEFTFGIEGISARLRTYLGKQADTETLAAIVRDLASSGIRQLKLFFIATGLETDDDFADFDQLLKRVRAAAPETRLIASFMPLFNAPFTPLQFDAVRTVSGALGHRLESTVQKVRGEFRWSASPSEVRLINLLCRLGRSATRLLVRLSVEQGFRYYDDLSPSALAETEAFIQQNGIDLAALGADGLETAVYPWDDLESGTPRSALWTSFEKTISMEKPAPAPPIVRSSTQPPPSSPSIPESAPSYFWAWLEPKDAWRPDITLARALLSQIFTQQPDAVPAYLGLPKLFRPAGMSGLALLKADFKSTHIFKPLSASPSCRTNLKGPLPTAPNLDELFWLVEFDPNDNRLPQLLESLRAAKISYQTFRREDKRWHVIGKRFRKRAGVAVLCEMNETTALALLPPSSLEKRLLDGARVKGVLAESPNKCPHCGSFLMTPLFTTENPAWPACLDCLS
ncbi:MAG TPA: hypothetical protein DCZ95_04160 [Verrucomicrobia bacterium]|nr:MAG: hypothetical protein A2X46_15255 [Lentisphaerae bacterium GWF2_57_35]HBA83269.1 hypothetical protein [Verrucomicrobiota bacterium]